MYVCIHQVQDKGQENFKFLIIRTYSFTRWTNLAIYFIPLYRLQKKLFHSSVSFISLFNKLHTQTRVKTEHKEKVLNSDKVFVYFPTIAKVVGTHLNMNIFINYVIFCVL